MSDQGPGRLADLLRLPRRALGSTAHVEPDRKRVRDGSQSHGADQGLAVAEDRKVDGLQADHGRVKDVAQAERRKSVAEGDHRRHLQGRRQGHRDARSARRLTAPVTQNPA